MKKFVIKKWDKPEPYFEIPESLTKKFEFLRRWPVRAFDVAGSGSVHSQPNADIMILEIYRDAIAVGSPVGMTDRKFLPWILIAMMSFGVAETIIFIWRDIASMYEYSFDLVGLLFDFFFACVAVLFALIAIWTRRWMKMPPDWPILFNRRTREITYFKVNWPHLFRVKQNVPAEVMTRPWDEAKLRTYTRKVYNGRYVRTEYQMALLWGSENDSAVLQDIVLVGNFCWFDEENMALWEHIRRYMEENGPPLNAGEKLRRPANSVPPLRFPIEIQEAAGGPPFVASQIARLMDSLQS